MKTTNQIKRSNRLNKKLYVAQYAVLGFEVSFKLTEVDEQVFDTFFAELIAFVDARDLIIGGAGGSQNFVIYVSSYGRYLSATEQDRRAFEKWLAERAFIIDSKVEALSDAYYGV
ncbi:MAG: 50S ribosome-binding protein YggL [Psychromonas sp.]